MKFRVFANATLFGLLLVPFAQAQMTSGLKANIPFEFRIGNTTHTAGEYSVVRSTVGCDVLLIRNLDGQSGATAFSSISVQTKPTESSEKSRLVFHRYGKTYFLSQVWQGDSTGLQLHRSKAERTIAHQMAGLRTPDTVEIALISSNALDAGN
ncbi:MAG: hypothetical protein ACJ746_12280 [Bryobacteraceae bacterium]